MSKILKNNRGFSLIELMIVVAIIGILSAIAVPNFQKFQLKARQTEAKNQLASLYSAQKAFQQEWSQYNDRFPVIGYAPEGDIKYAIAMGDGTLANPTQYTGPTAAEYTTTAYCAGTGLGTCTVNADFATALSLTEGQTLDSPSTTSAFKATASSDLRRLGAAATIDIWSMTQAKVLAQERSGI